LIIDFLEKKYKYKHSNNDNEIIDKKIFWA